MQPRILAVNFLESTTSKGSCNFGVCRGLGFYGDFSSLRGAGAGDRSISIEAVFSPITSANFAAVFLNFLPISSVFRYTRGEMIMAKRRADAYRDDNYLLLVEVVRRARKKFCTPADWTEELVRRIIENNLMACKICNGTEFARDRGEREGKCVSCGLVMSFTAGHPIFDGIQLPEAYVLKILAMEAGLAFCAKQFEKATGICYNTCWNIGRKFDFVMAQFFAENGGDLAVSSAFYKPVFTRRSTITPAGKPPVEEQTAMEAAHRADKSRTNSDSTDSDSTNSDDTENAGSKNSSPISGLSETASRLYAALSNLPIGFDQLIGSLAVSVSELSSAITILELKGLLTSLAGDRYVRAAQPTLAHSNTSVCVSEQTQLLISESIQFIRNRYQGISRKYLQLYLADFWRIKWHEAGLPPLNIFKIVFESALISDQDIKAFVTPINVRLYAMTS